MAFTIKQGDTAPIMEANLRQPSGAAAPLAGAAVKFYMRPRGRSTITTNSAAAVTDAANGVVQYSWVAADTQQPGAYEGEFEVTYADGTIETFPNEGYIDISIPPQIN